MTTATTTERPEIECRGWGDDKLRTIEVKPAFDCDSETGVAVAIEVARVGDLYDPGLLVVLEPEAASRLAEELGHVLAQMGRRACEV
jgi:hypothetical protein